MFSNSKVTANCSRRFVLCSCVMRYRVSFFTDNNVGFMRELNLATPICDAEIVTYVKTAHLSYSCYKSGSLVKESN
jgi:hypothetical protein